MASNEVRPAFPVSGVDRAAAAIALDPDGDARWADWVARGRAHDKAVRRTFLMWAGALVTTAVIVYAFLG